MSSLSDLLLRITVDPDFRTKGATLTFEELDANFILLANTIKENIVDIAPGGIAPYDGGTTYQNGDLVTYSNNLWEYISPTPASGKVPGTDPEWDLRSSGVLSHKQNTDTHTDSNTFGIGDGTPGVNKTLHVRNGDVTPPAIRYNESTNKWEFSNNGDDFSELGTGGGIAVGTAAGTDTYTLTLSPALTAYTDGLTLLVKFENTNTTSATLNVNSLGAKAIVTHGNTPLVANQLISGKYYMLVYDGERFQVTDIPFVANSSSNKLAYIDNNGRVRLADGSVYNSTTKGWTHTAATNDGTEAVRWDNSNNQLLFRLLSDRVAEFGTSGAAGIEIPTSVASENAYLLINDNQDVGFRILDRNGDVFSDIKTTNGDKRSIFRQPIGKAFTFDFETIIKQVHALASDDGPSAQNILATVEVPSGYYIHVRLKTAIAWSALGRMISSRPIVAIGFNTGTLEGTAEAPAPIYHGGPANGGFNINFNGSTGKVEIRLENENDGGSGYNYVCDLEFEYTLIPIPA